MNTLLHQFGLEIWVSDGPVITAIAGFHYPTRMVVIRLNGRDLAIWSPIELTDAIRAEVDALGNVRFLVPPNSLHHTFLGEWQQAYPTATTFAPPGLRSIRKDIRFDIDFGEAPIPSWDGEIDLVVMHGNRIAEEVILFHRQSATAIFADLLQQFPRGWFRGWRAIVARLDLMVEHEPSVPRKFRMAFTDKAAARAEASKILAWPTEKVLIAHGKPVMTDGRAFLRRAFGWLM